MRNLTPARVTLLMFGTMVLLVMSYVGKRMFASVEVETIPLTRNVPMALSDLEPGTRITDLEIGLGPMLVDDLEANVLLNRETIIGRIVKNPISAALPIKTDDLYKPGDRPPLQIADGMQAVTIAVGDRTDLVNGLIKPNDYVDLLLTTQDNIDPRIEDGMTVTLLRGIKVLTINGNFQSADISASGNAVTLEVTSNQARVVTLAQNAGALKLVFNPDGPGAGDEFEGQSGDRITLAEVLNLPPEEQVTGPEAPFLTEHFRAGQREVYEFRQGIRTDGVSSDLIDTPMPVDPSVPASPSQDVPKKDPSNPSTGPSV